MKHLFSCLKAYRTESVLAPLFKLFEAVLELFVPLVVAEIVNRGTATGDKSVIIWGTVILVCFGVVGLVFALTAQFFAAKAAVGASAELRTRLFHKLQSYSYAQIDKMGTATMITRMTSDVNQVQTGVNMSLRLLLRAPIIVFGAMGFAYLVDVRAALVITGVIPLLALVVCGVMAACMPLYRRVQEKLDGVYSSTRENLEGVRVIRAFCREEDEIKEFTARSEALKRSQKKAGRIAAVTAPITFVLINVAAILLVWVGAIRVDAGALEQGDVLALYSYLSLILVELVKLANLFVVISRVFPSMKRIGSALDERGEPQVLSEDVAAENAPETNAPALAFEGVTFRYAEGGAPALQNISFSLNRGETLGILGGTGSGKSTLAGLIPRFYAVEEGSVRVDGVNVNAIPVEELRSRVGIVPQRAVLFRGTIRENLLWGNPSATEEELLAAVNAAQAADVVGAKGGLDGEVAQEGRNLSGGQRQRLTIARALVRNPEILILDDSASALDYATDARLRAALKERGGTTVIISQRAASVMHADKILLLDDGAISDMGTHNELMSRSSLYREIYFTQFREGTV